MLCIVRLHFADYRIVEQAYVVNSDSDIESAIEHCKHTFCDGNPILSLQTVDHLLVPIDTIIPTELHR